jgi:hypothetical protein
MLWLLSRGRCSEGVEALDPGSRESEFFPVGGRASRGSECRRGFLLYGIGRGRDAPSSGPRTSRSRSAVEAPRRAGLVRGRLRRAAFYRGFSRFSFLLTMVVGTPVLLVPTLGLLPRPRLQKAFGPVQIDPECLRVESHLNSLRQVCTCSCFILLLLLLFTTKPSTEGHFNGELKINICHTLVRVTSLKSYLNVLNLISDLKMNSIVVLRRCP